MPTTTMVVATSTSISENPWAPRTRSIRSRDMQLNVQRAGHGGQGADALVFRDKSSIADYRAT